MGVVFFLGRSDFFDKKGAGVFGALEIKKGKGEI